MRAVKKDVLAVEGHARKDKDIDEDLLLCRESIEQGMMLGEGLLRSCKKGAQDTQWH